MTRRARAFGAPCGGSVLRTAAACSWLLASLAAPAPAARAEPPELDADAGLRPFTVEQLTPQDIGNAMLQDPRNRPAWWRHVLHGTLEAPEAPENDPPVWTCTELDWDPEFAGWTWCGWVRPGPALARED